MSLVYYHDFRTGFPPTRWGWGDAILVPEGLQLSPGTSYAGVFGFYVEHDTEWAMETKVKFVASTALPTEFTNIQLMTREGEAVQNESGMVIYLNENYGSVRHMVSGVDVVLPTFPVPFPFKMDTWYKIRFVFHAGKIECFIDDVKYFEKNGGLPTAPVKYQQPHLAIFRGTAIFEYLKVYSLPPIPPIELAASLLAGFSPVWIVGGAILTQELQKARVFG